MTAKTQTRVEGSRRTVSVMAGLVLAAASACGEAGSDPSSNGEGASSGAPTAGGGASSGGATAGGSASSSGGTSSGASGAAGRGGSGSAGAGADAGGNAGTGGVAAGGTGGTGGAGGAGGAAGGSGGQAPVACPAVSLPAGNSNRTLQVGGKSRSYVLHVPAAYTGKTPSPLLLDFHGHGGTGLSQSNESPYPRVVDAEGVLVAFPTAIGDWNMGPCCADDVDDVAFAKALVAEIKGTGCVDPKRVYATGFSMGGGMSHQLACLASDVFAAVGPAAFDLLEEHLPTCKPSRPITVAAFRGTADNLALYNGGLSNLVRPINFLGAVDSMKKWGELNGCTGQAMDLGNNCQGFTAAQCSSGVESVVCIKNGGGHEQGNASLIWPILKRHQLP